MNSGVWQKPSRPVTRALTSPGLMSQVRRYAMPQEELKIVDTTVHQRKRYSRKRYPRLYISPENESVLENLIGGRHNRPADLYHKALPAILKELGLPEDTEAVWSQYAGCSCPCSPGFILKDPRLQGDGRDFWVTVGRTQADETVREAVNDLKAKAKAERTPGSSWA